MQHTETTTIDRSAEEVWAFVGDVQSWPNWLDDVTDVEVPSGGLAEDTQISYKFRGRPTHPTITAYDEERELGISSSERGYEFAESITLQPGEDQTDVTFTMGFEPAVWWTKALAVLITPFRSTMLGRPLRKELRALKTAVESVPTGDEEHA